MAEQLIVYEHKDKFATVSKDGEARIWQVRHDGVPILIAGRPL